MKRYRKMTLRHQVTVGFNRLAELVASEGDSNSDDADAILERIVTMEHRMLAHLARIESMLAQENRP